jgi:hypothetical protein
VRRPLIGALALIALAAFLLLRVGILGGFALFGLAGGAISLTIIATGWAAVLLLLFAAVSSAIGWLTQRMDATRRNRG